MLVLSRRLGEKIVIGDNIMLTVVGVAPDKIRLGIEAPRSVPVYREELLAPQERPQSYRPGKAERTGRLLVEVAGVLVFGAGCCLALAAWIACVALAGGE